MTHEEKKQLIDIHSNELSIIKQTELLGISRSSLYYTPIPISDADIQTMNAIDRIYTQCPFYGSRRIRIALQKEYDIFIGRDHTRRLMCEMGLEAVYPHKKTSIRNSAHPVYPYLLRGVNAQKPNHIWGTDISYVRLNVGFAYLVAIIDWYSRYVLSWQLANSMDGVFCQETLRQAIDNYDRPVIHNSDQGRQFTANDYTDILKHNNIQISMDGRGRCLDNIFTERLWRTVKYEDIYIKGYENIPEAKHGLNDYFNFYNNKRFHQSLNYKTPAEIYFERT